jgi:hypothetical protein
MFPDSEIHQFFIQRPAMRRRSPLPKNKTQVFGESHAATPVAVLFRNANWLRNELPCFISVV